MSTFNGIIEDIPGIAIDRFEDQNISSKYFFLSHCHTDHIEGLNYNFSKINEKEKKIVMSKATAEFLKQEFSELQESNFVIIKDGEPLELEYIFGDNKYKILVTSFPARHCPGSVMFLLQFNDKNILYTGDIRISSFEAYSELKKITLDKMYLDSTFLSPEFNYFPTQEESVNKICELSKQFLDENNSNRVVILMPVYYCWLDFPLLKIIYEYFKQPMLVTNDFFQRYESLEDIVVDEQKIIIKDDSNPMLVTNEVFQRSESVQDMVVDKETNITNDDSNRDVKIILEYKGRRGFLYSEYEFLEERKIELQEKYGKDLKIFIPTAFRWRYLEKDQEIVSGKYVACSSHCSFSELRNFVHHFNPEQIYFNVLEKDQIGFLQSKNLAYIKLSRKYWKKLFNM